MTKTAPKSNDPIPPYTVSIPETLGGGTFERAAHPDAQWFDGAGLGLFVHWGISTLGIDCDLSWGMMAGWNPLDFNANRVSPAMYYSFADRFSPDRYDPDKYLAAAAKAGFRYAVFTTKHHDGYAMYPSRYGQMGTRTHMGGRDLVAPFVRACRRHGLKVGLYYSPPDWYFNREYMNFGCVDAPGISGGWHHEPKKIPKRPTGWDAKFRRYLRGQIREILTRWGKIDLLFFDGDPVVVTMAELRKLQPHMVINPRMHGYGDYDTIEGKLPEEPFPHWWELCEVWNEGYFWGYTAHQAERFKPLSWMLPRFTFARGWGGNYLINCPPDARGEMPAVYYERMAELSVWMRHSRSSVFNVSPGPYPDRSNVPVTTHGDTWYLHVPMTHTGPVTLTGVARPKSVTLLRTRKRIQNRFGTDGTLTLTLTRTHRSTDGVDVVRVRW